MKILSFYRFTILLLLFAFFFQSSLFGQTLSPESEKKISDFEKSVKQFQQEGNKKEEAGCLNKIAYIYWENNMGRKAGEFFKKSLIINNELNNKNAIKSINNNLGFIYSELGDYQSALNHFEEGLEISRLQKNKQEIASNLQNTAQVRYEIKQYDAAIKDLEEAVNLAIEENNLKLMQSCFSQLAENYEKSGNARMSKEYYEKSAALLSQFQKKQLETIETQKKDAEDIANKHARKLKSTIDTLNTIKESIQEIQLKAELMEKENQLKDLAIKEGESRAKAEKFRFYFAIAGLLLMLFVLGLVAYQFQQKKKVNRLLQEQNGEIEKQRDLANRQKQKITDSILYAKRIQNAILPPEKMLKDLLQDYFIYYKPRDIVSGDFYWLTQKENVLIMAAADCTGHGVPGAFMSMLGIAFLNEIVNKIAINKHIRSLQASEILQELRSQVINSLHQTGERSDQKDGMDIALCIIDFDEKRMQFAGAHNPLFVIRNNEIMQFQGDKMPVSYHKNNNLPFTQHYIDLQRGDTFYIFSDGYTDQFGGDEGMKFLQSNFKNLLLKIHTLTMNEQKMILEKTFEEWKGKREQVDDVMVIGFRYSGKKIFRQKGDQYNWEDRQILIAEDTDVNYFLLVEALRPTKAKVIRVKDGKSAVEFCKTNTVDLILMDINMPEMNGFDATRLIKSLRRDIPVIIQTALNGADEEDQSTAVGADDFISKPIDLKTFLYKLDKYLS